MNPSLKYFVLSLFLLCFGHSYSQFTGGISDGFAINSIACPTPSNVFTGGLSDGFAKDGIACPVPSNVFTGGAFDGSANGGIACPTPSNIFTGGSYDGSVNDGIACPTPSNVFTGGSYDGFSLNGIACVIDNIFSGGSSDGFAINTIACPVTIFVGGSHDGFAFNSVGCQSIFTGGSYNGFSLNNIACPPIAAIFTGGAYDGFSLNHSIPCPISAAIFTGGSYDGFALNTIACLTLNIFTGGAYDGFSLNNSIPCPISAAIFTGGSYDGFSLNSIACLIPINVFRGGSRDGFSIGPITPCTPLPIELLYFKAECNDEKVLLSWATATETNNDYFTIGRTPDGINYQDIGTIQGADNSNQILLYSFIDTEPLDGISYYHLKQTDNNGQFEYFDLVTTTCNNKSNEISIYPNPIGSENIVNLTFKKIYAKVEIDILSNSGNLLKIYYMENISSTSMNISEYPSGMYFIRIYLDDDRSVIKKVIKL